LKIKVKQVQNFSVCMGNPQHN